MQLRSLFGLSSLSAAFVLALVLVLAGGQSAPQPARPADDAGRLARESRSRASFARRPEGASIARAHPSTVTVTKYFPLVYGPPAVEMHTVTPHDGARFSSGAETWEAARAGSDTLRILKPYGNELLAKEQAPSGTLVIYAFSRSIGYFDTSDIADRQVAGDLTLTYYNTNTRQPLDLNVGLRFRRAPAPPATREMWGQFEGWPLLASRPVTTSVGVTRTLTLDASQFVEPDGTLPETVAIGVQTTEPYLDYGQSIYSRFPLGRMSLTVLTISEEQYRE